MPIIPLGISAYKREDGFVPEVECRNMYLEKDPTGLSPDGTMRIQRPGLVTMATLGGKVRGMAFNSKTGQRVTVAGTSLYLDNAVTATIPGIDNTPIVATAFAIAVLAEGTVYLYTDTLTTVLMPDNRTVTDIEQLNGYIILACDDGRFYWIEPGETTVDALNFATAESSPDGLVAVRRLVDELWMFGTEITEVWQSTGDADAPFQRVSGRQYERGCLARDSVRRFDNSLLWMGDDGQVYRGGAVPQVISDSGIAERIRKRVAGSGLSAWVFGVDGHKFYVLRIPGQGTFAFDAATSAWCQFASPGQDEWLAHVGYEVNATVVAGSSVDGRVWSVTPAAINDDGVAFERVLTGTIPIVGRPPRNDSLTIGVGASADTEVELLWKDGQDDYPAYADALPVRAPLDFATMYRLGQPDQPYRTFKVTIRDNVRVRVAGMVANQAWGGGR